MLKPPLVLDPDQRHVVDLVRQGHNVLATGKAGSGKSLVIAKLRNVLPETAVFLAPTGMAARNIGGVTVHSFFHFPPTFLPPGYVAELTLDQLEAVEFAQTIIIDEVSMLRADTLAAIDDNRPFFWHDGRITHKGTCGSSATLVSSLGRIHMRGEIWRELVLVGHWIAEAIVLRWAELTHEISRRQVPIADVVGRLLVAPTTERDQQRVRDLYRNLPDLRCVWTEDAIGPRRGFEIDHIIPFSLWHNNDLWNLVPATREANNAKRDRLVSRERLRGSRDLILDYWQATRKASPDRFDYEIRRSLLSPSVPAANWEFSAFSALSEAIESVACQRGIPRWPECAQNTISLAVPAAREPSALQPGPEPQTGHEDEPATERCILRSREELVGREFVTALPLVAELAAGLPYDGFSTRSLDSEDWLDVPEELAGKGRFVVRVNGDSMEPGLQDGDYVLCEWHRTPRRAGQVVIMGGFDDGDGTFAIKRFEESAAEWLFHSDNPAYAPIRISKDDVPSHPILGIAIHNLSQGTPIQ